MTRSLVLLSLSLAITGCASLLDETGPQPKTPTVDVTAGATTLSQEPNKRPTSPEPQEQVQPSPAPYPRWLARNTDPNNLPALIEWDPSRDDELVLEGTPRCYWMEDEFPKLFASETFATPQSGAKVLWVPLSWLDGVPTCTEINLLY